ncbi:MAG TPA: hypothetical protein VK179_15230 [Bacteroidales bacterium]|nr:hypothetical protein [Bacteroidales bacterium]
MNIPGWRTNRKLIIIESDDWGSIRMPSKEVYNRFNTHGFEISKSEYNRLDSLENNDDLESLFEVLSRFNDFKGNHPVITANVVVGNPDFKKIKESGFTQYFVEPVTETLKRYSNRNKVESLWKQGDYAGIFHPQFHGREHVNIIRWMNALKTGTKEIMFTFNENTTFSGNGDYNFMEVLDYNSPEDLTLMQNSLKEGLAIFENIFLFKSKSFIPPCYTWGSEIEETLHLNSVRYIQGLVVQSVPTGSFGNYTKKYHYLGEKNRHGQYFLIRNCFFEPSLSSSSDPVGDCIDRIRIAFRWKKPAIICTHRINFIGSLDEQNRTRNLARLNELFKRILMLWPDAEFITSDTLGDMIAESKH